MKTPAQLWAESRRQFNVAMGIGSDREPSHAEVRRAVLTLIPLIQSDAYQQGFADAREAAARTAAYNSCGPGAGPKPFCIDAERAIRALKPEKKQ